jgi:outer membrane protein TolC
MKKLLILGIILSINLLASTVSFEEALEDAFNNNNELKAKKLDTDMAKQDFAKAKSYDGGRLYFEENAFRTNSDSDAAKYYAHATGKDHVDTYITRFVYEFPIFTGFKIKYAKKITELQIKAKKFKFQRDKNKLAVEILKAYNGAVAAKYFIKALRSAKKTTSSFVKMTKNMYRQGLVVSTDVYSAQKQDSDINSKIIDAKGRYLLAIAYLRFLTGNNDITDVRDFKVIIPPSADLGILQQEALKYRNDVKYMQKNVSTMKNKVKMDESVLYPEIGAHLEFGWNTDKPKLTKNKDYYIVGGRVKFYFFNAGDKQNIEKSKISYHQTGLYYLHMKNGIKLEVEQKYLKLKTATALIKTKLKNEKLATLILNKYKSMYRSGLINISILLLKEAEKERADAELIKAKYDQAIAAAELELAIGKNIGGIR